MMGKRLRFLTMIGAAAGIPYIWFNEQLGPSVNQAWQSLAQSASSWTSTSPGAWERPTWPTLFGTSSPAGRIRDPREPGMAPSANQLAEVLRFDVTQRWVIDHWSRVSTVRAERDLVGFRVPLVTGTSLDDFAGSLTYYFDARQRLCRITLHGQTGDDRTLASLVSQQFGLRPEPSLGAGIYLLRWNTKPLNVLRLTHAPVVRADEPHAKLIVELELNDVGAGYGISPEFQELLRPDQHVRRWSS